MQYDVPFSHLGRQVKEADRSGYSDIGGYINNLYIFLAQDQSGTRMRNAVQSHFSMENILQIFQVEKDTPRVVKRGSPRTGLQKVLA